MRGLFLRRIFPEPAPKTVVITVTGDGSNYCYLLINGTKVTSAGTYEVEVGTEIDCYAAGSHSSASCEIILNGSTVKTSTGTKAAQYSYAAAVNATIDLARTGWYDCTITITEG